MKKVWVNCLIAVFSCAFIVVNGVAAQDQDFLGMLKSTDYRTRLDALKIIERSAVEQPEVFSYLNGELKTQYMTKTRDKNYIDELAWMCKALVSSGDDQYLSTVEDIIVNAPNKKLVSHCTRARDHFDTYVKNRKILLQPPIEGYSIDMSKNINMLQSRDVRMMRYAVNNISKSSESTEAVYDMVRDVMIEEVEKLGSNTNQFARIDTLAYFCKCLGASGYPKYVESLKQIKSMTASSKLKQYASKAINALD